MIRHIQVYRTTETDPYKNLAVEQYLMERVGAEEVILYLWQNRRTVVIGRNQNPFQECSPARLISLKVLLARRLSGGGAVYHDLGNLNFTFLARKDNYDLQKQLDVIVEACRSLGIPAERTGRNDIVSEGRKFSGNAFYERQRRCYHHGTLLVDVDMAEMSKFLTPSRAKLESKGVTSVRARVVNLKELRSDLTVELLADRIEAAFAEVYGLTPEPLTGEDFDWSAIGVLTNRNSDWDWLYGRSSASSNFSWRYSDRFPWGELSLEFVNRHGMVRRVKAYSDSMDWQIGDELERVLKDRFFRASDLTAQVMKTTLPDEIKRDVCTMLSDI